MGLKKVQFLKGPDRSCEVAKEWVANGEGEGKGCKSFRGTQAA